MKRTRKSKVAPAPTTPAPAETDFALDGDEHALREARAMLDASDALDPEHFARAYGARFDTIVRDVVALAERLADATSELAAAREARDQAIADGADAKLERDQARDELEAERKSREELQAQLDATMRGTP